MTKEELLEVKKNATVLFDNRAIEEAINQLARNIDRDYYDKTPLFIVVLNGGLIFAGQLLAKLNLLCEIDYCHATRYQGEIRGAQLVWKARPQTDLENRDVVLIDDILDEGVTLQLIEQFCRKQKARSVKTVVLVEKKHCRKAYPNQQPDYCELTVPDRYVFGFGMDYSHFWRNTKEIYVTGSDL